MSCTTTKQVRLPHITAERILIQGFTVNELPVTVFKTITVVAGVDPVKADAVDVVLNTDDIPTMLVKNLDAGTYDVYVVLPEDGDTQPVRWLGQFVLE